MRPRSAADLLDQLTDRVHQNLARVAALAALPEEALRRRPRPEAWHALECIEHANRFTAGYLPRVSAAIAAAAARNRPAPETFTSSWLGNQLAAGMKPGPKTRKIPTLRKLNPLNSATDLTVLQTFREQSEELLRLIGEARNVDLTRTRVKTVLTSLLVMRLGDVLRMVVNHDWRHTEQAERAATMAIGA